MIKKPSLFLLSFILVIDSLNAATVDTVEIYSNAMHKNFNCVVIKPTTPKRKAVSFPVVYLLHGYSGNYSNWIMKVPVLKEYADRYQLMIVCPDGGFSSWYFDSPVDSTMKYETYIGKEVPAYIDTHYPTIKDRTARAITGLSMGGHGGLFLAFRHPDFFGACGSMSGGVDVDNLHTRFDVAKRLGDTITAANNWKTYSMINAIGQYKQHLVIGDAGRHDTLSIIFDCGINDIFFTENHALHEKLLQVNIPHDYTRASRKT